MSVDGLYLMVEGTDDQRLIEHICLTHIANKYSWIKVYQYAQRKPKQVCAFIRSVTAMGADYIFFGDADLNPAISTKKGKLCDKYVDLDEPLIQIVVQEIESWYLAGLNFEACGNLGLSTEITNTELINKEQFNALIPKRFSSRIDFMTEIIKMFSVENAVTTNRSFAYFVQTNF